MSFFFFFLTTDQLYVSNHPNKTTGTIVLKNSHVHNSILSSALFTKVKRNIGLKNVGSLGLREGFFQSPDVMPGNLCIFRLRLTAGASASTAAAMAFTGAIFITLFIPGVSLSLPAWSFLPPLPFRCFWELHLIGHGLRGLRVLPGAGSLGKTKSWVWHWDTGHFPAVELGLRLGLGLGLEPPVRGGGLGLGLRAHHKPVLATRKSFNLMSCNI